MTANSILKIFTPQRTIFFDLFDQICENLTSMGGLFLTYLAEPEFAQRAQVLGQLKKFEHDNDQLTHTLFTQLSINFITPFDREDIHSLGGALDDIADFIYGSAKKINFYAIDPMDEGIQRMAPLINECVGHVRLAVLALRKLKNGQKVREHLIRINDIENDADDIFDWSISHLFATQDNVKELIKMREVYEAMERATDSCEEVSRVIESILIKYA
jgi:uncharacterized protein Yka (UPF0111/DUF47 family)